MATFFGVLAMLSAIAAVNAQSDAYLTPHNAARQAVGANIPDLSWDTGLESYASQYAQKQATQNNCQLVHSGGPYGENIYWSSGASTPGDAVQAWVNEKQWYDYATNTCQANQQCGHYTQIVWRNTQRVGCGSASCTGGATFVVCSYDPPGNYVGQWPY
jgi:pathogenesis-related protein 1